MLMSPPPAGIAQAPAPSQGAGQMPQQQGAPLPENAAQIQNASPQGQLQQLSQNIIGVLEQFSSSFPGGEEKLRMATGLIMEATNEKIMVLERMQGPQPTPPAPY